MICPMCSHEQPDSMQECRRCGVIFARIHGPGTMRGIGPDEETAKESALPALRDGSLSRLMKLLLAVPPGENPVMIVGRSAVFLVLLVWGGRLMASTIESNYVGESFLHLINLPFHEAGHLLFSPLGRLIQYLGGTLGQWLAPFVVACAFLGKGNRFGASVGLWWLGESFLDISPYMADARAGKLILLGGVTGSEVADYHDWQVILSSLGWLRYDHIIARITFAAGGAIMTASLAWGACILWKQYRGMKEEENDWARMR